MRQFTKVLPLLTAKAATGVGNYINVEDYETIVIAVDTESSANLTVKFQGSISEVVPDFTAAQSKTNQWDYVQIKDLEDGSSIDGDTGLAPAGTDDHRHFEVNVNHLKWFNPIVTARSAGAVTVVAKCARVGGN